MTIDQFKADISVATLNKKIELLSEAFETFNVEDEDIKDMLLLCKDDILDLQIEEDLKCNKDIDDGLVKLYTCVKPINGYVLGERYYVRVDDLSKELGDKWGGSPFMDHINSIPVVNWIYTDSGLGTLKKRVVFNDNFSEYFQLYVD